MSHLFLQQLISTVLERAVHLHSIPFLSSICVSSAGLLHPGVLIPVVLAFQSAKVSGEFSAPILFDCQQLRAALITPFLLKYFLPKSLGPHVLLGMGPSPLSPLLAPLHLTNCLTLEAPRTQPGHLFKFSLYTQPLGNLIQIPGFKLASNAIYRVTSPNLHLL